MKQKRIFLATIEDAKEFVAAASKCDFDIDISNERVVMDAKSLLGVMGMGIEKQLTVKYGGENLSFENVLSKYEVA